jgi:hypothetical protein
LTRSYTFRVFLNISQQEQGASPLDHIELGTYENLTTAPWVPPVGSYFRFRDPEPPNKKVNHGERKGRVKEVVTCFYGANTTIEVYIDPDRRD